MIEFLLGNLSWLLLAVVLALLLSACSMRPVRTGAMIGPSWPHGVCDVVDACWIVP